MKKKILFVIIIFIIVIVLMEIIKVNYIKKILNEIVDIYTRLKEDNNIYYESIRTGNNDYIYKMWLKDSKVMINMNETLLYYADFEKNEFYQKNENEVISLEDKPSILENGRAFANPPVIFLDGQNVDELSLKSLLIDINIISENYNGIECLKISYGDEIIYCDKESLLPIKTITYVDGEVFEENTYKISFDTVTNEDVNFEKYK